MRIPSKKTIFLVVVLGLVLTAPLFAWEDCPFGLVNDRYPGKCGLYEDTNNDSICDHSQKNPSLLALAKDTTARFFAAAITPRGKRSTVPRIADERANAAPASTPARIINDPAGAAIPTPAPRPPSPLRQRYPLWQIFVTVLVLGALTEVLIARNKRMTLPLQAAWNWVLGLSFLLTFASSLVFVYPALLTKVNFNMSYWHSPTGLVMIAAGLYHFIRRFGSMWRGAKPWFPRPGRRRHVGHD